MIILFGAVLYMNGANAYAQSDSTEQTNVNFSIYPVFGYQPETRFAFGLISFIVYDVNGHKKMNTIGHQRSLHTFYTHLTIKC